MPSSVAAFFLLLAACCSARWIRSLEIEDDHARTLRCHHLRRAEAEPVGTGAAGNYRYLVF